MPIEKLSCGCSIYFNDQGYPEVNPDIEHMPLDCPATWDYICNGNTKGVFQLESSLGQSKAKQAKPRSIEELSDLIAIIRPGCVSQNTKILTNIITKKNGNKKFITKTIKELYECGANKVCSIDYGMKIVSNNIKKVIYSGLKECFNVKIRKYSKGREYTKQIDSVECTINHEFLRSDGQWIALEHLEYGDRIAIIKKKRTTKRKIKSKVANRHAPEANKIDNVKYSKYFKEICYQHYLEKCCICGWDKASLDTHHIEGNRYTNNNPDNLAFLCPNCHRLEQSGVLDKETIIKNRENNKLLQSDDCEWVTYIGKESIGIMDTYDIMMEDPYHNFIANDMVVHNCSESIVDGKSLTQHYIDRKAGIDEVKYFHPALEPILKKTYGILVFQEQALRIAREIAGYSLQEAELLRKAIGKKKVELMQQIKTEFADKASAVGIVTKEEAQEIFSWIEKSQRYSFNASHSVSYAMFGYLTAYIKCHTLEAFFTSFLRHSDGKPKPKEEIAALVNNARLMDIDIYPPSIMHMCRNFKIIDGKIRFGITNVKGVGDNVYDAMQKLFRGENLRSYNWDQFVMKFGKYIKSDACKNMIEAGVFDDYDKTRLEKLDLYDKYKVMLKDRHRNYLEKNCGSLTSIYQGIQQMIETASLEKKNITNINNLNLLNSVGMLLDKKAYTMRDKPSYKSQKEVELLGIDLTATEIDEYDTTNANCTCREFMHGFDSTSIAIAVRVNNIKEYKTKRGKSAGESMAFVSVDDGTCSMDVTVFAEDYKTCGRILKNNKVVLLRGQKDKNGGFLVKNVLKLEHLGV